MSELSDAHAMAIERSCAVTAVALSGQRREGVRLVTGAHREFSVSSSLDFVHVPYPSLGRDWTRRTLTCGIALQCSPSKERLAGYRLNELSTRELVALTLVEAGAAIGWVASTWPGLLPEVRRLLPDLEMLPGDVDAEEMLNRAVELARSGHTLDGSSATGQVAAGVHDAAGTLRQTAAQFRQDALDHNAEARSPAVFGARGRRRWCTKSQSSATEPAPGQRSRRHPGAPSWHPVSGVERVDEELHAGPRRGPRAPAHRAARVSRRRRRPTCGNGSPSTPTAR